MGSQSTVGRPEEGGIKRPKGRKKEDNFCKREKRGKSKEKVKVNRTIISATKRFLSDIGQGHGDVDEWKRRLNL